MQSGQLVLHRLTYLSEPNHTGLAAFLGDGTPGASGVMLIEYAAAAALGDLRSAADPAALQTTSLSRGAEDTASFASLAARQLLHSAEAYELLVSCELVTAVRQVAAGRRYLAPAVAQQLALATLDGSSSPFDALSSRELEVAMMLVRGKPLTVIGEQLNLSPKTVSTYKQRLMEKLRVEHVLGLAHLMTAHGLIDAPNHQVGA